MLPDKWLTTTKEARNSTTTVRRSSAIEAATATVLLHANWGSNHQPFYSTAPGRSLARTSTPDNIILYPTPQSTHHCGSPNPSSYKQLENRLMLH